MYKCDFMRLMLRYRYERQGKIQSWLGWCKIFFIGFWPQSSECAFLWVKLGCMIFFQIYRPINVPWPPIWSYLLTGGSYWPKNNASELHFARSFQGHPTWPYLERPNMHIWPPNWSLSTNCTSKAVSGWCWAAAMLTNNWATNFQV